MRKLLLFFLSSLCCITASAQQRVSVGFWNVENLYDTIPSRFYDDSDYTPQGRYGWNTEKYRTKLTNLAKVIDDVGFDVIALAEVENEAVVRDLVLTLRDDYNYLHYTSSDSRGIDLAILYKGDKFFLEKSGLINSYSSRELMHVIGELTGQKVQFLICHMPSKQNRSSYREKAMRRLAAVADSLQNQPQKTPLIIMGDFNCDPSEKLFRHVFGRNQDEYSQNGGLYSAVHSGDRTVVGSYAWNNRWYLFDNIFVSLDLLNGTALKLESGGVFVRAYMLEGGASVLQSAHRRSGYPLRTFASGRYTAGFSDHLPVYAVFQNTAPEE